MSETAARQCDRVLPAVPYRQWVLSLPWELRMPVARDPALLNAVSRVFFEEVRGWLREAAGALPDVRVEGAAVTYVQRFGGSLNLNPHLHVLVADGVFACRDDGSSPVFMATPAPMRADLRGVIEQVIERLETIARRREQRAGTEGVGDDDEDVMEGLRRAAGGRGTFARVDEKGGRGVDTVEEGALAAMQREAHGLVAEVGGFNVSAPRSLYGMPMVFADAVATES